MELTSNLIFMATILAFAAITFVVAMMAVIWKITDDARAKTNSFFGETLKVFTFILDFLLGGQIAMWVMNTAMNLNTVGFMVYTDTFVVNLDANKAKTTADVAKIIEEMTSAPSFSLFNNILMEFGGIALTTIAVLIITYVLVTYRDKNLPAKKERKARIKAKRAAKKAAKKAAKLEANNTAADLEAAERAKAEAEEAARIREEAEAARAAELEAAEAAKAEAEEAARAKEEAEAAKAEAEKLIADFLKK